MHITSLNTAQKGAQTSTECITHHLQSMSLTQSKHRWPNDMSNSNIHTVIHFATPLVCASPIDNTHPVQTQMVQRHDAFSITTPTCTNFNTSPKFITQQLQWHSPSPKTDGAKAWRLLLVEMMTTRAEWTTIPTIPNVKSKSSKIQVIYDNVTLSPSPSPLDVPLGIKKEEDDRAEFEVVSTGKDIAPEFGPSMLDDIVPFKHCNSHLLVLCHFIAFYFFLLFVQLIGCFRSKAISLIQYS